MQVQTKLMRKSQRKAARLWKLAILAVLGAVLIDLAVVALNRPAPQSFSPVILPPRQLRELLGTSIATPGDPDIRLLLAETFLRFEHYLSARQEYNAALDLGANEWSARSGRARCNMALLRYDLATEDLKRLIRIRPARTETYLTLAEARQLMGDILGARAALSSVPLKPDGLPVGEEKTNRLEAAGLLATANGYLGDWDKALAIGRRCAQIDPTGLSPKVMQGKALHALGRKVEAIPFLEAACKIAPGSAELEYLLGTALLERNHTGDEKRATQCFLLAMRADRLHGQAAFELAKCLERQGKWNEAATAYFRAYQLGIDGGKPLLKSGDLWLQHIQKEEGWYRRGLYFEINGQFEKAAAEYGNLTKLHSTCRSGYLHLARLERLAHKPDQTVALLRKAQEIEPGRAGDLDVDIIEAIGETQQSADRRATLLKVAEQGGKDADEACFQLAQMADIAGKFDEAQKWVARCVGLKPKQAGYRFLLGKFLLQQREDPLKLKAAVASLEEAVRLSPESSEMVYMLGLAYSYANQPDDAILALRHSIDLQPEFGQGYQTLSQTLLRTERKKEGSEMLATARRFQDFEQTRQILTARVKREPNSLAARRRLAEYHMAAHEYVAAVSAFEACLVRDPMDRQSRTRLAELYGLLGRHEDRRTQLAALNRSQNNAP